MRTRLTFPQWRDKYGRTEDETRVYAECLEDGACDDPDCEGWVLTYRDSVYPHERPLTTAEREQWGVPDPHPDMPLLDLYTERPKETP